MPTDREVVGTERPLADREGSPTERLRFPTAARGREDGREAGERVGRVRVRGAPRGLQDLDRPPLQPLVLGVVPAQTEQRAKALQTGRHRRMLGPVGRLARGPCLSEQGLRLGVPPQLLQQDPEVMFTHGHRGVWGQCGVLRAEGAFQDLQGAPVVGPRFIEPALVEQPRVEQAVHLGHLAVPRPSGGLQDRQRAPERLLRFGVAGEGLVEVCSIVPPGVGRHGGVGPVAHESASPADGDAPAAA